MAAPKLRFKDDQGRDYPTWERQKLGNIFVQTNNYSTLDDKKELYSLTVENGITPKTERYDRSFLVKKNDKFKIVRKNEFVYNPMNMTIGAVGYNNLGKDIIVSGYYVVMKSNNISANRYWYNWLKSPKTIRLFKQKATGSLIEKQRIQFSTFEKIKADIPSLPEQEKIANFLSTYDRMLDVQSQRVETMKLRKKGLLQKIFSQEIRFRNNEGKEFPEWEEKRLGEIIEIIMGQSPNGSTYSDVPSKYILVQGNADLKNGWVTPRVWTTQKTKMCKKGDIILSVRAPAGAVGRTNYDAVIGRGVAAIKGNEFVYQLLLKMYLEGYWKKFAAGSIFESLNSKELTMAEINIPSLHEQQKIADFLTAVDHQIEIEEKRLETMKIIKKGLLQQMFI